MKCLPFHIPEARKTYILFGRSLLVKTIHCRGYPRDLGVPPGSGSTPGILKYLRDLGAPLGSGSTPWIWEYPSELGVPQGSGSTPGSGSIPGIWDSRLFSLLKLSVTKMLPYPLTLSLKCHPSLHLPPPPQRVVSFTLLPVGGWGEETGDNSDFLTLIPHARF